MSQVVAKVNRKMSEIIFNKSPRLAKLMLDALPGLLLALSAFPASAATANGEVVESVTGIGFDVGLGGGYLLQVLGALFLVVFIILALSVVVKKFRLFPGGSERFIKVIAGISLSSKDRLLLIQVGDEQILISASPGNISKVHKLSSPVEPELVTSTEDSGRGGFSNLLNVVNSRSRS